MKKNILIQGIKLSIILFVFFSIFGGVNINKVYASFGYKASITINHTKVPNTDQTDFPILVSGTYAGAGGIPDLRTTGNGGKVQNANGYDIYFYSDSALTTRIPAERESYDASTGNIIFWVKKTVLTASDTVIYIAYGDSGISTDPNSDGTYGATSTWDTSYKGVWHLPNGTTLTANDSTGVNNGTLQNTPTAITGIIDGGARIRRTAGVDNYISVGNNSSLNNTTNTMSIECWLKRVNTSIVGIFNIIFARGSLGASGYLFGLNGSNATSTFTVLKNTIVLANIGAMALDTNFHHVVMVMSGSGMKVYVDGSVSAGTDANTSNMVTSTAVATIGPTDATNLNNDYYLDEVRVSSNARSADWIATSYNNQNSPSTFYTIGSETAVGNSVIKSILGLAKVNVKAIIGVAITSIKSWNGVQ